MRWLSDESVPLRQRLAQSGALHFVNFTLPSERTGLRTFCDALSAFVPCEDPLTSVGVRKLLSAADGVYEAVNSEALSKTFIGLHNDATYKLTAPYAAFACIRPASSGGDFLVVDGRQLLADLPAHVLEPLCAKNVSVRVAALELRFLLSLPATLRQPLARAIELLVGLALRLAVPLELQLAWGRIEADDGGGDDGGGCGGSACVLQILETAKPPVNRHPVSGEPTFFSSLHSQSRYLQRRRAALFSESALSRVASTDAFYGVAALTPMEPALLDDLDAVMSRLVHRVPMRRGDVVLLDSYQVLHGRDVFDGPREHAVVWLADR